MGVVCVMCVVAVVMCVSDIGYQCTEGSPLHGKEVRGMLIELPGGPLG